MMTETERNSMVDQEELMKWTVKDVLKKVVESQEPLSKREPGYFYMFHEYLTMSEEVPKEIKLLLPSFIKIIRVWINQHKKAKTLGVLEYLTSCKGLLGVTFQMSLSVETMEQLTELLNTFQTEMTPTSEDCCSLVSTKPICTLSTTVVTLPASVDVRGCKKRKLCMDSDDEDDLSEDDLYLTNSQYPTSKTFSSISRRKDGEPCTLKLEDEWKEYQMKCQLWRSKDLKDSKDWKDKANKVHKTMILNFDEAGNKKLMHALGEVEEVVKQYLKKGGARRETHQYGGWRK
uniref:NS2 n=1 Tax=uncultured densovirus TaxID=748192 RepID=A0A7M4BC26_9VIRU|nr:NS2 [uncultured densovirus]